VPWPVTPGLMVVEVPLMRAPCARAPDEEHGSGDGGARLLQAPPTWRCCWSTAC